MGNEKKRSFKKFLEECGEKGIKKVAIEYATETDNVTIEILSDKYNLSQDAVKKCFEYAIVNQLSYKTAVLMKNKAHRNQARHAEKEPFVSSSDEHYSELFKKRMLAVKKMPDDKVANVVFTYLTNPHLSAYKVSESLGLSCRELNALLEKAIIFRIVDADVVSQMKEVAMKKNNNSEHVRHAFERFVYDRALYENLNNEIAQLYYQLETYEHFVSSDQEFEHSKETIEKKIEDAEEALQKFKDRFYNE